MRVLGLMTGTSVDAVDYALVSFFDREGETDQPWTLRARIEAAGERAWPADLRARLTRLITDPATASLPRLIELDAEVGTFLGAVARAVCREGGAERLDGAARMDGASHVDLIVCPGQTVFHHVQGAATLGTLALGNPARVHDDTGIPVLSHVRDADIAAGGTGAPLAPILDALLAGDTGGCFVNIGGIANLTVVPACSTAEGTHALTEAPHPATGPTSVPLPLGAGIIAGDTGPGNALIDAAVFTRTGHVVDEGGALAASGKIHGPLLEALLADPYFTLGFPKSTGREHFGPALLQETARQIGLELDDLPTPDLLATLTELTARSIALAIQDAAPEHTPIHLTGGGAKNTHLVSRLTTLLHPREVRTGPVGGIDPDTKEAVLMALIGYLSASGLSAALPSATGARVPALLGSLTPATGLAARQTPTTLPRHLTVEDCS